MNIQEALEAMAEHSRENPTHGNDCACKDRFTLAAKLHIRENPELYNQLLLLGNRVRNDNYLMVKVNEKLTAQR